MSAINEKVSAINLERYRFVRNHLFSRKHGVDNSVFVEIIRHLTNCKLIRHSDNDRKKSDSSISLEELFETIISHDKY